MGRFFSHTVVNWGIRFVYQASYRLAFNWCSLDGLHERSHVIQSGTSVRRVLLLFASVKEIRVPPPSDNCSFSLISLTGTYKLCVAMDWQHAPTLFNQCFFTLSVRSPPHNYKWTFIVGFCIVEFWFPIRGPKFRPFRSVLWDLETRKKWKSQWTEDHF